MTGEYPTQDLRLVTAVFATNTATKLSARRSSNAPMFVDIVDERALKRPQAEEFIHENYARNYGADVRHFLPRLMTLHDNAGELMATLGFCRARTNRLFLEQYLDKPVETVLSTALGADVGRYGLVEVGNLAASRAGGSRWLIAALTAYLKAAGYDWAVFTAVPSLRNSFVRMGVELVALAPADKARLSDDEQKLWGAYYDTEPVVVAANVHQSFRALTNYLRFQDDRYNLKKMWDHALAVGAGAG